MAWAAGSLIYLIKQHGAFPPASPDLQENELMTCTGALLSTPYWPLLGIDYTVSYWLDHMEDLENRLRSKNLLHVSVPVSIKPQVLSHLWNWTAVSSGPVGCQKDGKAAQSATCPLILLSGSYWGTKLWLTLADDYAVSGIYGQEVHSPYLPKLQSPLLNKGHKIVLYASFMAEITYRCKDFSAVSLALCKKKIRFQLQYPTTLSHLHRWEDIYLPLPSEGRGTRKLKTSTWILGPIHPKQQ